MVKYDIMSLMIRTFSLLAAVFLSAWSFADQNALEDHSKADQFPIESVHTLKTVEVSGDIVDIFRDEYDQNYRFVVLKTDDKTIYAVTRNLSIDFNRLIGASVRIRGKFNPSLPPNRRYLGSTVVILEQDDITVLKPGPRDPFAVTEIGDEFTWYSSPEKVVGSGIRRMRGHVLASWQGRSVLIERADSREVSRLDVSNQALPGFGAFIEAVGYSETDLCCLNLSRVRWRPAKDVPWNVAPAADVSGRDLYNYRGYSAINRNFHGKAIRLTGTVLSSVEDGCFQIDCDGNTVVIDASSCPEIRPQVEVGSRVRVCGVCVIDIDNWRPNEPFPRARGLFTVIRTPEDFAILSPAPWWTAARLLTVIGVLVLAIVLVSAWCVLLRRLAEQRGRELFRRQIAQAQAEFKVEERTRLAVELHDSLAQNLSGVAMEIEVAQQLSEKAPAESARHLDIAARTLDSSRNELRNCLWDLRCNALEENDLAAAVRRTMTPHCKGVRLHVRFDIRRSRLSDNTTHALLRLIRELALNGIRHGKATDVHIVGAIDGKWLRFSVRDNGCGFNPAGAPGVTEGHFGIQGVRERLAAIGGDLTIESEIGRGTKATGRIPAPTADREGDHEHA